MHPNMNFGTTLVVFAFPSIMGLEDHIKNVLQKKNFRTKVLRGRSKIGNIGHYFLQFGCQFLKNFCFSVVICFCFSFYYYYFCFCLKIFLLHHDARTPNFLPKDL